MAASAVVRSRGRITLPSGLLRALDLKLGDAVQFTIQFDGAVLVTACRRASKAFDRSARAKGTTV